MQVEPDRHQLHFWRRGERGAVPRARPPLRKRAGLVRLLQRGRQRPGESSASDSGRSPRWVSHSPHRERVVRDRRALTSGSRGRSAGGSRSPQDVTGDDRPDRGVAPLAWRVLEEEAASPCRQRARRTRPGRRRQHEDAGDRSEVLAISRVAAIRWRTGVRMPVRTTWSALGHDPAWTPVLGRGVYRGVERVRTRRMATTTPATQMTSPAAAGTSMAQPVPPPSRTPQAILPTAMAAMTTSP